MKRILIILFTILSACGNEHPPGIDSTIKSAMDALENNDCEKIIKLQNPFDKWLSIEQCNTLLSNKNHKEKTLLLMNYSLNAIGKLDQTGTIYTIDTSKTKSGKNEVSFININGTWYLN